MNEWRALEYSLRQTLKLDFHYRVVIDAKGFKDILTWQKLNKVRMLIFFSHN